MATTPPLPVDPSLLAVLSAKIANLPFTAAAVTPVMDALLMAVARPATVKPVPADPTVTSESLMKISLPLVGVKPFNTGRMTGETLLEQLRDITLPATSLAILGIAADSRFGRAAMLETLNQDYIRTARAKGLAERRVVWKHALRNALIPIVTLWALNFSALLGGAVVTESIFSWPGLGPAFLKALGEPDLALVLGFVIFTGVITIVFNLIADLLYGVLDPRIRFD